MQQIEHEQNKESDLVCDKIISMQLSMYKTKSATGCTYAT